MRIGAESDVAHTFVRNETWHRTPQAAARIAWACPRHDRLGFKEDAQFPTGVLVVGAAGRLRAQREELCSPAGVRLADFGCGQSSPPSPIEARLLEASWPTFQSGGGSNYDTPSNSMSDSAVAVLDG